MGKLDGILTRIKANANASRKGPDRDFSKNVQPVTVTPSVAPAQRQPEAQVASPDISNSNLEEPPTKMHKELVSDAIATKHPDLKKVMDVKESFSWNPNIEVCRSQSNAFEEFKKLRTNLINMADRHGFKSFMITSCKHAEGKTTTALALARSLAELGGRRVCLVDTDIRRPRVKTFLNLKINVGLDDVILEDRDLSEAMVYSKQDNLAVLPTRKGRALASEMLGSEKMVAIVRDLTRDFDIVLFDTPPCLSTTDPVILGNYVDATSLVVKMNHTPRQSVEHSIALMRQSEITFIGLILTHHVVHYNTYLLQRYNYYQDYYGYYENQDSQEEKETKANS